jgi:hypothetical protein
MAWLHNGGPDPDGFALNRGRHYLDICSVEWIIERYDAAAFTVSAAVVLYLSESLQRGWLTVHL